MNIKIVSYDNDKVRLAISDRSTSEDVSGHVDPLVKLLGESIYEKIVLIDMSESVYIDSSGIGWLVTTHKKFNKAGGRLVLHSFRPEVLKILSVLRMQFVLNICKDENEAFAIAQKN